MFLPPEPNNITITLDLDYSVLNNASLIVVFTILYRKLVRGARFRGRGMNRWQALEAFK